MKLQKHKLTSWEKVSSLVGALITVFAGTIIWTNESIDLLVKLGWKLVNGGQAFLVLSVFLFTGLFFFLLGLINKILK